ncbi:MAG: hypothetical protein V4718_00680 [Pseudomonadota bacterium]
MTIPFFGEIERLITEHGSATILKERIALLKDQFVLLESKVTHLEQENASLRTQNHELKEQTARQTVAEQYVEENGALFKKRPTGGYVNAVYCPSCKRSAGPFPPGPHGTYTCDPCQWFASFTVAELPGIIASLP